jgi:16S rRNA (uracil1498-N3)-methyltransferase
MSRRIRVAVQPLVEGEMVLDAAASHYLVRVHRLRQGDRFIAFDPEARHEASGELLQARPQGARCRLGPARSAPPAPFSVTLLQAIGKGDKLERVVNSATALGLSRIIVIDTERSVVGSLHRVEERKGRWRKVAVEAARQSGRGEVPELLGPLPLPEALQLVDSTSLKLCFVVGAEQSLGVALSRWRPEQPATLLIGPEGGLTAAEVELATATGFRPTSLGPYVLRTELAASVVAGALLARLGPQAAAQDPERSG